MYREVQRIRDEIQSVQEDVRAGILADSTSTMTRQTSAAMAKIDAIIRSLTNLPGGDDQGIEPQLVQAAQRALTLAWTGSERVAIGSTVGEMREALVDCKTYVDFAEAYVRASLGVELEE